MKTANILVIYSRDPDPLKSLDHLTEYCDQICKKYGCNSYVTDVYWLENLKRNGFDHIMGQCYEGLYLIGCFTKEDLYWPIKRQRPRYEEI